MDSMNTIKLWFPDCVVAFQKHVVVIAVNHLFWESLFDHALCKFARFLKALLSLGRDKFRHRVCGEGRGGG